MFVFIFFSDCKFNCHRRCESQVPPDCRGERANGEGLPNYTQAQLHVMGVMTHSNQDMIHEPEQNLK